MHKKVVTKLKLFVIIIFVRFRKGVNATVKEATGELNMTVVTIVLIGVIAAFFAIFWDRTIQPAIEENWQNNVDNIDDIN